MLPRQQIIKIADANGVHASTVERDYVLAHSLAGISFSPASRMLIFKGGMAIRMCHVEQYRYSADLDFSLIPGSSLPDVLQTINAALETVKTEISFPLLNIPVDQPNKIEYVGPLGSKRWIKLDIDADELTISPSEHRIFQRYEDLPESGELQTYDIPEMAAEKLRCVLQRLLCRDLFDLHHLFFVMEVDLDEAWQMFEKKARHRGIDPGTFFQRYNERLRQYKVRWEGEMSDHVEGSLPKFEAVVRQLNQRLRPRKI